MKSFSYTDYTDKLRDIEELKSKTTKKQKYITIKLDGLFIEEDPTITPFDFLITSNKPGQQLKQFSFFLYSFYQL